MSRIGRHQLFMEIAHVVAKRASCFRLSVGCVITVNNRIVSIGWNGPPAGEAHCTGQGCAVDGKCVRATHAELNALRHVPQSVLFDPKDIYVTDSPCADCFRNIVYPKFNVNSLYYGNLYRVNDHLIDKHGYPKFIRRITPSGYIIDHATNEIVEAP